MKKLSVAILAGGDSSEKEISMKGAEFVLNNLSCQKYDPKIVVINQQEWTVKEGSDTYPLNKNDFSYTKDGIRNRFDFALIIIHGTPGENGILQAYLELIGIPYSTGRVASSANSFDKYYCKLIAEKYGIPTAKGIFINKADRIDPKAILSELNLPLFIKPNASGSSFGVTKVKSESRILPACELAFTEDENILVEESLNGREVSCGMFAAKGKEYILPVTEIVTDREFFDFEAKYKGMSNEITPADLPQETVKKLNDATRTIYRAMRCRGVVRIDFIIQQGTPYMIEINNIPGMSPQSIIPQQLKACGLTTSQMYDLIIEDIIERQHEK